MDYSNNAAPQLFLETHTYYFPKNTLLLLLQNVLSIWSMKAVLFKESLGA